MAISTPLEGNLIYIYIYVSTLIVVKNGLIGPFPAGLVDKNLLVNAADIGLVPVPGRFHTSSDN